MTAITRSTLAPAKTGVNSVRLISEAAIEANPGMFLGRQMFGRLIDDRC